MTECHCQRCGEPFPPRQGGNLYCRPCGPLAIEARSAVYRKEHKAERRLYEAKRRRRRQHPTPITLLRCWCGNLFVPHSSRQAHCTASCGAEHYRARKKANRLVVAAPAPVLPPVDYNLILTEMMQTMRRAQAEIETEQELAGRRIRDKQERLARIVAGIVPSV